MGEDLVRLLRDEAAGTPALPGWDDPAKVKHMTTLVQGLYASRRLHRQQYVFLAALPIESLHHHRIVRGRYDHELKPMTDEMQRIEDQHGLDRDSGEFWRVGDGPADHQRLNKRYEAVLDAKLVEAFDEFGLGDIATVLRDDPKEFFAPEGKGSSQLLRSG
ncbi:MAG: hypothetical protein M3256_21020 [Actinomycetota bacterium]|nr:hypothetical protein [Actinomycetota bacterium]